MFGKGKSNTASGITLIANNCEITGDIRFSDQLLVNGVVKGNIYAEEGSKATVTISEKGRVKGDIRVPNVIVNGKVYGDIHSGKHIELAARAEVTGNVYYNLIEMVMGSRVEGSLVHTREAGTAPAKKASTNSESAPAGRQPPKPADTEHAPAQGKAPARQRTEQPAREGQERKDAGSQVASARTR